MSTKSIKLLEWESPEILDKLSPEEKSMVIELGCKIINDIQEKRIYARR